MKRLVVTCLISFATLPVYAQTTDSPAPAATQSQPESSSTLTQVVPAVPPTEATPTGAAAPSTTTTADTRANGPLPAAQPAPAAAIVPTPPPAPAEGAESGPRPAPAGPLQIVTPQATIKFGFLLQPQYETVGSATLDGMAHNLFLRRTRLIVGGTLFKHFDFFFDTDFANLFKAANAPPNEPNLKSTPGMNVQDAFATAKAANEFMVDVGYMLPPLSHNALQGATSLYGWDYFANSFRHSNAFGSTADPIGRDSGIQVRGLVIGGVFEYRIGIFQGRREEASTTEIASRNFFRVAGRLQINLLDPETGFFYAGSYLGKKRILSFGASYDFQDSYQHASGDGFLDMPVGPGVLTAQVNVVHWNGSDWVTLPNQTALMGEAGYLFDAINLSPIARFERRWVANPTAAVPEETRVGGGLAFWPYGHNINVKAFYTHVAPDPAAHGYHQLNVQSQLFVF